MRKLIRKIARFLGLSYRPVEPMHVFVGADPENNKIGIILETGDEEIEVKLEPYQAAILADKITEMLTKLVH